MKLSFFIMIFCVSINANIYTKNSWNKLLHYYNNENQITSKEFFLSDSLHITPIKELTATINLLNSENGKTIACNFPARYKYLKINNYNIPNFNLSQCKELTFFLDSFSKDNVSLVFTSEYINNPSSAFGHIMILFSDNNSSLNIGDAVHFSAKISKKDGFFKYSYKGFNGKYNGYFIREPFFKKIYEYNTLEQRFMYIYTLDFSQEQILQLLYHLFELRKASFKYYFLDGNCATQTTDLLNIVTKKMRVENIYYLPIDTINSYKNNIIKKEEFIPLASKLDLILKKMTLKEQKLFNKIIITNQQIDKNSPDIVKEAMVFYTTFNFRRFHKVYKNYNSVNEQIYKKQHLQYPSLNPLNKTKPSNIGLGLYNQNNQKFFYLHYRPLFLDIFDIQLNNMQESQINTLTFDLIINNNNIKIKNFDLANIKSFTTQLTFYKPVSWSIYSGFNRENKNDNLKFNNEVGLGRTVRIINKITASILLYIGTDDWDFYTKPYLVVNTYLSNNIKLGGSFYYKKYIDNNYQKNQIFLSTKKDNFLYTFEYINDSSIYTNKYLFSIKYNF